MIRRYRVTSRNSTVCGLPGRLWNWSKFDWAGKESHRTPLPVSFDDNVPKFAEYFPGPPTVDRHGSTDYLHVPYNYAEEGTIFRVRPNNCMWAGEIYRGRMVQEVKAVKIDGAWYWELHFAE